MSEDYPNEFSPEKFGKVAVVMGGSTAEREVSLESGGAVLQALLRHGIDAHGVDFDGRRVDQLLAGDYQRVFIALHGRGGEDGQIQGLLQTVGLPYTGSGVLGSALAMDKIRAKGIWRDAGLPTPAFRVLQPGFNVTSVVDALGLPLMVKPAREGSSIGVSKVVRAEQLSQAFELAFKYDVDVLAEQFVDGAEYTAAIVCGEALPLVRLTPQREFYDYAAKYEDDRTRFECPSGLPSDKETELRTLALRAFKALGGEGWGRVDFFIDELGSPWLIELNTVPGMTSHSLVPMAAKAAGMDFDELVLRILSTSLVTEQMRTRDGYQN